MSIQINKNDITFEYFKRSNSKGGQKQNKTSSAVRITHIPTGIVLESSTERSQTKNKQKAIKKLQEKLDEISRKDIAHKAKETYDGKPEASFSSQIRTYRLCGKAQGVTDHRTGITHGNVKQVLEGDIDIFLNKGNISD